MGAAPARSRFSFGREHRIATQAEYERLLRSGVRKSLSGFTFIIASGTAGSARLGILMSLKVSRRANVRNRVKRCIREAFRLECARLGAVDVLVRPPQNIRVDRGLLARLRAAFVRLAA